MMENNVDNKLDPDYAGINSIYKRISKSKEDGTETLDQFTKIVNEEFDKELSIRQDQLELIENRIHKTQKLLHLMKYILVSSYYNRQELEYNGNDEAATEAELAALEDQTRMHPAIKKLLGQNSSVGNLSGTRSKRRKIDSTGENEVVNVAEREPEELAPQVPSTSSFEPATSPEKIDRNRRKIKKRIIVGNISKWMPSDEDDNLTHKWMIYVRGPKDSPDVSYFIKKVIFHLHPSYKPFDVVEINESPFHLSRRGWGEFPIRIQIVFKSPLNKPVDIIHNLKLDKTYSGRQTLGSESLIDLFLYDDAKNEIPPDSNISSTLNNSKEIRETKYIPRLIHPQIIEDSKTDIQLAKYSVMDNSNSYLENITKNIKMEAEEIEIHDEPVMPELVKIEQEASFEHDYCYEEIPTNEALAPQILDQKQIELLDYEHCYSCPSTYQYLNIKKETTPIPEQPNNPLIYGLNDSYLKNKKTTTEPLFYKKTIVYTAIPKNMKTENYDFVQRNGKIVAVKKKAQESLLKTVFPTLNLTEKDSNSPSLVPISTEPQINYELRLPQKFKNVGESLPYIFKRLPLFSPLAKSSNYLCLYPFTATSITQYLSWSDPQKSSSEWTRARIIGKLLTKNNINGKEKWNTKAILMYGRSHGYTPGSSFYLFRKSPNEIMTINTCFEDSLNRDWVGKITEPVVDIETNESPSKSKKQKLAPISIADAKLKPHCSFIRQEALDCGIILKNEEIVDGVYYNAAERAILESVICLANQLIRRGFHHKICDNSTDSFRGEIELEHVKKAIKERKEFSAITEFKKQRQDIKFFH